MQLLRQPQNKIIGGKKASKNDNVDMFELAWVAAA
jgi:hypothetical protein